MKIAINGFGRIGRNVLRSFYKKHNEYKGKITIVAINDISSPETLLHLLKYDSVHGRFDKEVHLENGQFHIEGEQIQVFAERDIAKLPWGDLGVDLVIESTGVFLTKESVSAHIAQGAKKVLISAPAKGSVDATIVVGVNDADIDASKTIYSNASCTTNCLAPVAKVLNDTFGIESGFMNTIHAYTNDQRIVDAPHSDLRRSRAAAASLIPTTTGATKAVEEVIPALKGKLQGQAVRVPVINGSLTDFVVRLTKPATVESINAALKHAAEGELKGILEYQTDPIVSVDIIGNPHSGVLDSLLTQVMANDPHHARVGIWYDNEWGYSNRVLDVCVEIGATL